MLTVYDRPGAKAIDPKATVLLTAEQLTARTEFGRQLAEQLSKPGVLESLGAFITPGNNADKGTLMVACTLSIPSITFINPDGQEEKTRPTNFNLNATIPTPATEKAQAAHVEVSALSYSELRRRQMQLKAANRK